MSTFTARYRGTCESCDGDIEVGQEAAYVGEGIVHVPTCPADATTLVRPVCPHCFCEVPKSGTCECRE